MLNQSAFSGKTDAAKLSLISRGSCQRHRCSRFRINDPGGGVRHCVARAKPGNVLSSTVLKSPGANTEIRWGTFLSKRAQLDDAIDEAVKKIQASFGVGAAPDLAIVMVSSVHGPRFNSIVPLLRKKLPSLTHIFGCSGYGVVGSSSDGLEALEGEPAFNLTLGQLPGVDVRVLHTLRSSIPPADATPEEWAEFVGVPHDSLRPVSFLLFAEPRFAQIKDLVAGLDYAFPNAPKIGAVLSTGTRSKSRAMFAWSANAPAAAKRRGTSASSSAAARLRARLAQSEGSTALSLRRSGYGLAGEPLDLPYRGGSRRSARAYPPAALRELQLDMMDNMLQGTEEEEEEEAGAAEEGDAQAGADRGKAEGRAGADQVVGGGKVGDSDNSADGKGKRDLGTAVSEQRAGSSSSTEEAVAAQLLPLPELLPRPVPKMGAFGPQESIATPTPDSDASMALNNQDVLSNGVEAMSTSVTSGSSSSSPPPQTSSGQVAGGNHQAASSSADAGTSSSSSKEGSKEGSSPLSQPSPQVPASRPSASGAVSMPPAQPSNPLVAALAGLGGLLRAAVSKALNLSNSSGVSLPSSSSRSRAEPAVPTVPAPAPPSSTAASITAARESIKQQLAGDQALPRDASSNGSSSSSSGGGGGGVKVEEGGGLRVMQALAEAMSSATTAVVTGAEEQWSKRRSRRGPRGRKLDDADESGVSSSGLYLYGATCLALHGDVQLDTITSMGYRAPSPRVWRIATTAGNSIMTIKLDPGQVELGADVVYIDKEDDSDSDEDQPMNQRQNRSRLANMEDPDDPESKPDDRIYMLASSKGVQAVTALVDVLDCLPPDSDEWEELLASAVVAVAADTSKALDELQPSDWEMLPLTDINEEFGSLKVGNPHLVGGGFDLRPGHRMKLMLRDSQGMKGDLQDALLSYKRKDLAALVSGESQMPPAFGMLLLSDVSRGATIYSDGNVEPRLAQSYIPVPTSGLFGGGQIGPVQGAGTGTGIYEQAMVVGVLRAATKRSSHAIKQQVEKEAAATARAKQELADQLAVKAGGAAGTQAPEVVPATVTQEAEVGQSGIAAGTAGVEGAAEAAEAAGVAESASAAEAAETAKAVGAAEVAGAAGAAKTTASVLQPPVPLPPPQTVPLTVEVEQTEQVGGAVAVPAPSQPSAPVMATPTAAAVPAPQPLATDTPVRTAAAAVTEQPVLPAALQGQPSPAPHSSQLAQMPPPADQSALGVAWDQQDAVSAQAQLLHVATHQTVEAGPASVPVPAPEPSQSSTSATEPTANGGCNGSEARSSDSSTPADDNPPTDCTSQASSTQAAGCGDSTRAERIVLQGRPASDGGCGDAGEQGARGGN